MKTEKNQQLKDSTGLKNIVVLDNVVKKYEDQLVLKNISFNIFNGQILGYVGPNGSGKTTTIKILLGLLKPDSGEINILKKDPYLDDIETYDVKKQIGFVLESDLLNLNLTGFKNILYWAELYDNSNSENTHERVNEVIDIVNLAKWKDTLVKNYSHGMKKRLLFARAIVHNPQILILDEPTNGVDLESRLIMRNLIKKFASEDKIIFFSSHDLNEVQKICTKIIILNKGEKMFDGTLEELKIKHPNKSLEDIYLKLT
ncbi:MAG: ABC transporter ATP-binding protein [Methanobrevibacter sp.]|jgi:ABC-2 type transport system ATP-binding protein|nr:ABC transporter ATP-binding protein [Candidatus Methanovirga aequatorialis]